MERIYHGRSPYYKEISYSPQDVINYFHLVSDLVDKDGKKLGVSSGYLVHKAAEFISKFGLPPLEAYLFRGVVNADNPIQVM
ncbi:hypothetical protein TorRG33x02_040370 [Trema orientale]|uniref:Uncharacterized protein n=1 Tax=Trema orientale TaxID=63057 RepID=A0A2P5FR80_TREOI|nr:hypothetical protein TorRG33x02_040370 [Trema orientale]